MRKEKATCQHRPSLAALGPQRLYLANSSLDTSGAQSQEHIQMLERTVGRLIYSFFLLLGACSQKEELPAAQEKAPSAPVAKPKLSPEPGDVVVDGCLAEYPKSGHLGGGVDPQRVWKICMVESGQQSGLCDPSNMMGLATAVCIARGKGLPMAAQWRARLEFSPAPKPQVLWRLGLVDESAHTLIDVHTGQTLASVQVSASLGMPDFKAPKEP